MEKKKPDRAKMNGLSEQALFQLFEYQRFEDDPLLRSVIDGVESAYGTELSDDELTMVSAAGEMRYRKRTDGSGGGAT